MQAMRNFHVPLTKEQHSRLRDESKRSRRPATALAREAIADWLDRRRLLARDRRIAEFAAEWAGTELDLDPDLESAAVEELKRLDGAGD